jgi:hypothetical protein
MLSTLLFRMFSRKMMAELNSDLSQPGPPMILITLVGYMRILFSGKTLDAVVY